MRRAILNIFKIFCFSIGDRTRSFLKVQDGCDYFCSFCTIPWFCTSFRLGWNKFCGMCTRDGFNKSIFKRENWFPSFLVKTTTIYLVASHCHENFRCFCICSSLTKCHLWCSNIVDSLFYRKKNIRWKICSTLGFSFCWLLTASVLFSHGTDWSLV